MGCSGILAADHASKETGFAESGKYLRSSVSEGDVEGCGQALVRPASKVHQLHAEAAAEPHDIAWPQVPMHNVPLVKSTDCLADLQRHQPCHLPCDSAKHMLITGVVDISLFLLRKLTLTQSYVWI